MAHIIKFADVTSDILPQYFVAIEQRVLIECKSLERAIFIMLAVHYVFNMEYHPVVKDVLYFLQQKLLELADNARKNSSMYLSVSSGIDLYM